MHRILIAQFALLFYLALATTSSNAASAFVSVAQDGAAIVEFELPVSVEAVQFENGDRIRTDSWTLLRPQGSFSTKGDGITFHAKTKTFSVRIEPSQDGKIDRTYSPLVPVGKTALAIYAPYLAISGSHVDVSSRDNLVMVDGRCVANGNTAWASNRPAAYIVIGTCLARDLKNSTLTAADDTPAWLVATIAQMDALIPILERFLSKSLTVRPWILATFQKSKEGGTKYRGDTLHGFIRVNFWGNGWSVDSPENRAMARELFAHELAHLWNGDIAIPGPGPLPLMLLEGGAEAISLEALALGGFISPRVRSSRESDALNRCSLAEGEYLQQKAASSSRGWYACGASLFILLRLSADGGTNYDALKLWARLLQVASLAGSYDARDFVSIIGSSNEAALNVGHLLNSKLTWIEAIRKIGPLTGLRPTRDDDISAKVSMVLAERLVQQLMVQDCKAGYGFWTESSHLVVDANQSCVVFGEPISISGANGFDFMRNGLAAYKSAAIACGSEGHLILNLKSGETRKARCAKALNPLPPLFATTES